MSAIRSIFAMRSAVRARNSIAVTRSFHSCKALAAGKESSLHHEGRADEAEKLKQQHLKDQKDGKNKWTEGLASDSESIVKADRGEAHFSKETISELQKESAKAAEQERK